MKSRITDATLIENSNLSCAALARKLDVSKQYIWRRFQKLKESGHVIRLEGQEYRRKYHLDLTHFSRLDAIGAYYLGLLYADGHVGKNRKGSNINNIVMLGLQDKDKALIQRYALDINFPLDKVKYTRGMSLVRVGNINYTRILATFGLDPSSEYKKHVPIQVFPLLDHFLRGFLDGDGWIYIGKRRSCIKHYIEIGLCFEYRSFGDELIAMLNEVGMELNKLRPKKNIWVCTVSHNKAVKLGEYVWANPIRCLTRKHKKWRNYIDSQNTYITNPGF